MKTFLSLFYHPKYFFMWSWGRILTETNESQNIHWIKIEELKKILKNNPEKIFLLHINALQKYLGI